MAPVSSLGNTRRQRRRRLLRGAVKAGAFAGLLIGMALAGYRVGLSQNRIEASRLEHDLAKEHERNRLLSERMARAEQAAEAAAVRLAQLQAAYRAEVPSGELRRLVDLATERLRQGVPAARLAFALREVRIERRCDPGIETKRLAVHTPTATAVVGSVGFADNRITITGEGAAARAADGAAQAWFDPMKPVGLRFLRIDGEVGTAEGLLPLAHSVVMGNSEFLFMAKASDRQPGAIDVTMQRCVFP